MENNYYCEISSELYDFFYSKDQMNNNDIHFYLKKAKDLRPVSILELGAGTGRITIPLSEAGHCIDGIEISKSCSAKLQNIINKKQLPNISIITGDMLFDIPNKKYDLIISPFRGIQHLYDIEIKKKFFSDIKNYLNPGGSFIFDVYFPNFEILDGGLNKDIQISEVTPDKETKIERWFFKEEVNHQQQYFKGFWSYKIYKNNDKVRKQHRL